MRRLLAWIFSLKGLFLILLILFFVVPAIESWRLETLRESAIRALEQKRGSRVIVLIHRQETVNVLGVPVVRYINVEDSEKVLRAIRFTDKNTPIDFIIHTPGGLVLAASQIAKAIKRHPAKTTVFVPHYARHQIVMDINAVLGPIDPQLGDFPAASVLKVVEQKPIDKVHDLTLVMADQSKKAIAQVTALAQELLSGKLSPERAKEAAHRLASGTWTHGFSDQRRDRQRFDRPADQHRDSGRGVSTHHVVPASPRLTAFGLLSSWTPVQKGRTSRARNLTPVMPHSAVMWARAYRTSEVQ
jgi:ClpP class serine protease